MFSLSSRLASRLLSRGIGSQVRFASSSGQFTFDQYPFLAELGLKAEGNAGVWDGFSSKSSGEEVVSYNPSTGEPIASVIIGTESDYDRCSENVVAAQKDWRSLPAPKRGEIVRQIGEEFRKKIVPLGQLISLEMGKIKPEGVGEVQEVVDMCELAVGYSRQLPGQFLPSERLDHSLVETWNPLGSIGIITAYNFPNAVAGWNASVSLVCGNTQIWKGAPSVNLVSVATQKIMTDVLLANGVSGAVAALCCGGADVGEKMIKDPEMDLISFTGSTNVGRHVSATVAARFGSTILELGGNNAILVMDDADLEVALISTLFAAVGTAGQRCTTARRLLIHENIYDQFVEKLKKAYQQIQPGNPLDDGTLLGPVHNEQAVDIFEKGIVEAQKQGGKVVVGGKKFDRPGHYVEPTLIEIDHSAPITRSELFVPISYLMKVKNLDEAIELNNSVPQGLSSALFTKNVQSTFKFLGPMGSDCGIANINTSCSGAEIGGAFGGNKETGGGRESGSDSWKQYMRRGTCTVNYGTGVPLAQGIQFG